MKNLLQLVALLLAGTILQLSCLQAQDEIATPSQAHWDTSDFSRVEEVVDQLLENHPPQEVLLVVDIDNTLLAMNQDLGSDQWFNWQSDLLTNQPQSPNLVADDFAGLLRVQGDLFALSGMHPPEPSLPEIVNRLQDEKGVTTIVLTSRGPEFRSSAERELRQNGYQVCDSTSPLQVREKRGNFKPYQLQSPDAHGLNAEIISTLGEKPRDVSFSSGIYMTAGQHKGYMLKTLLARSFVERLADRKRTFSAIVFVDDHEKHTNRMRDAFAGDPVELTTIHYMQEDGNVDNFENSNKAHVIRDWNRLRDFLDHVLVK